MEAKLRSKTEGGFYWKGGSIGANTVILKKFMIRYLRWFHVEHFSDPPLHNKEVRVVHVQLHGTE